LGIGIYENGNARPKWLKVSRRDRPIALYRAGLSIRESIGSVQGTVHVWFRLSVPPYFNLRELSTQALIKCYYDKSDYDAVLMAVQKETQVVHVHGRIFTDVPGRCIDHVDADRIVPVEPFSLKDLEKFFGWGQDPVKKLDRIYVDSCIVIEMAKYAKKIHRP